MNLPEQLGEKELRSYLEFLLWHYRVLDAFWFLYTAERFGQETAEELNQKVWQRAGELAAKNIIKRFNIVEKGLKGFLKAQSLYPWALIIGYKFEEKEEGLYLTVADCPSQTARLKRGLGEYNCKEMHRSEFEGFARVIDERICVECLFAPPDKHPENLYCKWRFYIRGNV
ncbi:MAG: DUF6125 family protein [Limisphaerales bacterium]